MEATASESIKMPIAFSTAFGLKNHYLSLGIELSVPEARKELRKRLERSRRPGVDFWRKHLEVKPQDGYDYLLDSHDLWPCLFVIDKQKGMVIECLKIGDWVVPVATNHAVARFLKYSARVGRYYSDSLMAKNDLLRRLLSSHGAVTTSLRNGEERVEKYPHSFYRLEGTSGTKVPLIFVVCHSLNRKQLQVLVVVTCFPFKGSGASQHKPKTRDGRAKSKMALHRLLKRPLDALEE